MATMKDITVAKVQKLQDIKLPDEWKVVRAEIKFERSGHLGEYASVIYDSRNKTFYVATNKAIVYPGDEKALQEALTLMKKANDIIHTQ